MMHGPTLSDHKQDRQRSATAAYWSWRTDDARAKAPDAVVYRSLLDGAVPLLDGAPSWPQLFANVVVYFNGRTGEFSSLHLANLVRLCGGKVVPYLSKSVVTHVVCTNLSASKATAAARTTKAKWAVHYVRPEWVLASITKRTRLNEFPFRVVNKRSTADIASFFVATKQPEHTRSPPPKRQRAL